MNKLKMQWGTKLHDHAGNALGYNTHNSFMKKYSAEYFDYDDDADIVLHIVPADHFEPIPNKFNVLFTMWETTEIPTGYVKALNQADHIIVPSRFCRDIFKPFTNKPIDVCFEGVEAHQFPFYDRKKPIFDEKFRLLWVGAPNPRKGYNSLLHIIPIIEQNPHIELYIKTTSPKYDRKEYITSLWKQRKKIRKGIKAKTVPADQTVGSMLKRAKKAEQGEFADQLQYKGEHKNIIFDSRKIPFDDLVDLYHSAHCFLFPTLGEGWGLTLCEAMATGCPSIATPITGCADFFDESVGYPIKYKVVEQYLANYEVRSGVFIPDTNHFFSQILAIFHDYNKALAKGKRASDRIHGKFTWNHSAKRLYDIIKTIQDKRGQDEKNIHTHDRNADTVAVGCVGAVL